MIFPYAMVYINETPNAAALADAAVKNSDPPLATLEEQYPPPCVVLTQIPDNSPPTNVVVIGRLHLNSHAPAPVGVIVTFPQTMTVGPIR
jgi:hypothetical protein